MIETNERPIPIKDYAHAHYVSEEKITEGIADMPVQRVEVIDISMPLISMVAFMVKWTIASIPALAILAAGFMAGYFLYGVAMLSLGPG